MNLHTDPLGKPAKSGGNPNFHKERFEALHSEWWEFKIEKLLLPAKNDDDFNDAIESICTSIACLNSESKRNYLFEKIPENIKKVNIDLSNRIAEISKSLTEKRKILKSLNKADTNAIENLHVEILSSENQLACLPGKIPKVSGTDLKKNVVSILKKEKDKEEALKQKAKQQNEINTAEDAGLPEDFRGDKEDVWAAIKYNIYFHNGVIYSRGTTGGDRAISNFTLKILYHVDSSDDQAFRLISVKHVNGFEVMININTDDFVSVGNLKKVLARKGDFVWKGNDIDLCRLQEFLQRYEISAKRVEILGWNNRNKFWAWSNGLTVLHDDGETEFLPVDQYGIVEHNKKQYFIPACSMMYEDKEGMFVNEKKFIYTQPLTNFGFEEWSRLMYGAYKKNAIPAILFYIGALFRDIMMAKVRRYPLLNLFGPPGAGKGELYDSIMHMFGHKQDQIMLGGATTVVGFMRKEAQFKNAIVGLDEYKNNLLQKVIESLKNLYDGIGYERGKMSNDFATESTPVNSSTILSGQDMPTTEPALFMRCIMLSFEEGKFTEAQRKDFQALKNDYEHHGLSYITARILKFRMVFEEKFKDEYQRIFKQTLKEVSNVEIDDRFIMNISIFLTIMHLTKDHLAFPFTYSEARNWLIDNMRTQHSILAGNNEVAKFWQIVEYLVHIRFLKEGCDFIIRDKFIFIRMVTIHPAYVKESQSRNQAYLDKNSLLHYLRSDKTIYQPEFDKDGKEKEVSQRFVDGSKVCFKFVYKKLNISLRPEDEPEQPEIPMTEDLPFPKM